MSKTLTDIAQELKDNNKKVQLIYAFNGTGKTRLSREFKDLIAPKEEDEEDEPSRPKILYYNAFTEDLFYWDNDLEFDAEPKLKIQPNSFIKWVLKDQGKDLHAISKFQHYTNDKLTPHFNPEYTYKDDKNNEIVVPEFSEVTFSFERGDENDIGNIKISKGEESNFIWSIVYVLLEEVIENLNKSDSDESTKFDQLEYVFIDDPVSSLDDNHLIELAVDLASLIKKSESKLKFLVTTHSPLFYNVLYNELKTKSCHILELLEDETFKLNQTDGDSNKSFSYHLYIKNIIDQAIKDNKIEKFHFMLLRNLYEKTSNFLGYPKWSDLLPGHGNDDRKPYYKRIIQFTSHSTLSNEIVKDPTKEEKQIVSFLLNHLINNYSYWTENDTTN